MRLAHRCRPRFNYQKSCPNMALGPNSPLMQVLKEAQTQMIEPLVHDMQKNEQLMKPFFTMEWNYSIFSGGGMDRAQTWDTTVEWGRTMCIYYLTKRPLSKPPATMLPPAVAVPPPTMVTPSPAMAAPTPSPAVAAPPSEELSTTPLIVLDTDTSQRLAYLQDMCKVWNEYCRFVQHILRLISQVVIQEIRHDWNQSMGLEFYRSFLAKEKRAETWIQVMSDVLSPVLQDIQKKGGNQAAKIHRSGKTTILIDTFNVLRHMYHVWNVPLEFRSDDPADCLKDLKHLFPAAVLLQLNQETANRISYQLSTHSTSSSSPQSSHTSRPPFIEPLPLPPPRGGYNLQCKMCTFVNPGRNEVCQMCCASLDGCFSCPSSSSSSSVSSSSSSSSAKDKGGVDAKFLQYTIELAQKEEERRLQKKKFMQPSSTSLPSSSSSSSTPRASSPSIAIPSLSSATSIASSSSSMQTASSAAESSSNNSSWVCKMCSYGNQSNCTICLFCDSNRTKSLE
jgi:hypothetical protein